MALRTPVAVALALAAATSAHAAPLRVVVLAGDADAPVVARLEGQVADLDVALETGPAPPVAPLAGQLARAAAVARERHADAVVWFAIDGDGWIVHVADPRGGRVLVRRVDGGGGALAGSAALEAAALVVRTALRGLAAGGEIGVVGPTPAPAESPPPPAEPPAVASRARPTARVAPFAAVGWTATLDGDAARGHHGVAAAVGLARGRWRGAITAALFPASRREDGLAIIELGRGELGGAGGVAIARGARWSLTVGLAVAAARFDRTTIAAGGGLAPTADRARWSLAITPAVRIARRLGRGAALEVAAGATALTAVPVFDVAGPSGTAEVGRLWPVEPGVTVQLVVGP